MEMSESSPRPKRVNDLISESENRPRSIKDQISESENILIKGTLELYQEYFVPKLDNIARQAYIQGNKVDTTFVKLLIEDPDENTPLKFVKDYITKNKEELRKQSKALKDLRDLEVKLLLEAVESENSDSLRKVLNWFENEVHEDKDMNRLIGIWEKFDDTSGASMTNKDVKKNNMAMIRACEKDNFEMVLTFFKFCFTIDAKKMRQANSNTFALSTNNRGSRFPLLCRYFENRDMEDILFHFRHFQATSKPAFMIGQLRNKIDDEYESDYDVLDQIQNGTFEFQSSFNNEDPVTESFHNAFVAKRLARDHVEYANKFKSIVKENRKFAVDMLDLCKTTDEAALFLSTAFKKETYFTETHIERMAHPRLEVAIVTRNIEFVAHDFCQQILRDKLMQSEETGELLPWNSTTFLDKGVYIISCIFLLPIFIVCKVVIDISMCCRPTSDSVGEDPENNENNEGVHRKNASRFFTFFTFPQNRFIAQSISLLVFLGFLITTVLEETIRFRWVIITFSLSHLLRDIGRFRESVKRKSFRFWDFYSMVTDVLLVSGASLAIVSTEISSDELKHDLRQTEACLTGIGVTLAITKLFYWCQLSSWLGPLAISIKKVFSDILMVTTAYLIFYLAFTVGIKYIMSVPISTEDAKKCGDDEIYNRFSTFFHKENTTDGALKTALWSMFDPGHPEYLGCAYGFARSTALTLWGLYQIVNITILINLLVALMNNTMALINKDKEKQWKFYRTEIWLRFLNDKGLCPPFNILDALINSFKCIDAQENKNKKKKEEKVKTKYVNLVSRLSRRYLRHVEDSDANDATREDLENAKRNILNHLKRQEKSVRQKD
eukprot:GFUD01007388.1.p1 GENE.GFUD01007388.1~~GFUD01007388.1.p1  ORF type:complete len:851 (-),score=173.68 GFUD01007388.1:141-2651(-)